MGWKGIKMIAYSTYNNNISQHVGIKENFNSKQWWIVEEKSELLQKWKRCMDWHYVTFDVDSL